MSTTRRKFLGSLAALMVAPFVAPKAKMTGGPVTHTSDDVPVLLTGGYMISRTTYERMNGQGVKTLRAINDGTSPYGPDFAAKMEKQIRGVVQDELIRQKRPDGFLAQRVHHTSLTQGTDKHT